MQRRTTPGPWFLDDDGSIWAPPTPEDIADAAAGGYDAEPYKVADVEDEADARLIVAAVNAYADLVAACEAAAVTWCWPAAGDPPEKFDVYEQLLAAIARARGGA